MFISRFLRYFLVYYCVVGSKDVQKSDLWKMDLAVDPNYEYDAPQFVDFTEGIQQFDPDADKWFGKVSTFELSLLVFSLKISLKVSLFI